MSRAGWTMVTVPAIIVIAVALTLALLVGGTGTAVPPRAGATDVRAHPAGIEMVALPGGEFVMGAGGTGLAPRHVRVAPFEIGRYEVTQAQWQAVLGRNRSKFKDPRRPVEQVTWLEVQEFIQALNRREGTTHYRLPTEAEWEYAARAGATTAWHFGDDATLLARHAWFGGAPGSGTRAVGGRQPNAWGLFDMHGNVWEWVQDCWHDNYDGAPADAGVFPGGDCNHRVVRGGGWDSAPAYLHAAERGSLQAGLHDINVGFRLARSR